MIKTIQWQQFDQQEFLRDYWQKKPIIIKGAFANFQDPIEAEELAGLAMEEFIESRIVSNLNQQWQVKQGPFEDYSEFEDVNWTLLVQAVNHWFKDVDNLIEPFRFIPNWRIDDVMMSFSTPGGGVGPHLDQYDVFIIQGMGKRRWQVGLPDSSLIECLPHEDLKQVSAFTPAIDEITESGDLLYIPPNHPHDGTAIENSLNYSIGFQAPNAQELISAFADYQLDNQLSEQRFNDEDRKVTTTPENLASEDVDLLVAEMKNAFNDKALMNDFMGKYLSSVHHTLNLLVPVEPMTIDLIKDILADGETLDPVLGLKCILINQNENKTLYINGEKLLLDLDTIELGKLLASKKTLTLKELKSSFDCLKNVQLLTNVINKGLWSFE